MKDECPKCGGNGLGVASEKRRGHPEFKIQFCTNPRCDWWEQIKKEGAHANSNKAESAPVGR